jgi:hypothetical protein
MQNCNKKAAAEAAKHTINFLHKEILLILFLVINDCYRDIKNILLNVYYSVIKCGGKQAFVYRENLIHCVYGSDGNVEKEFHLRSIVCPNLLSTKFA